MSVGLSMDSTTLSATSSGPRLLHEQLRAEIALLQLELNQLTTHNAQLLRQQQQQVAAAAATTTRAELVDAGTDAMPLADVSALTTAASPALGRIDFGATRSPSQTFDWDDGRSQADSSATTTTSTARHRRVYGASASRLCPVVVAGDDEPSFRVCEVGTDAQGNSVIVHLDAQRYGQDRLALRPAAAETREAACGPGGSDGDADRWRSMCAVEAGTCLGIAAMLRDAAATMAAGERALLGDGALTACDVAEDLVPMAPLSMDDDSDDGEIHPARASRNASTAFAHLRQLVDFVHDRATELRDTALARQVALTTYLQRAEIDRQSATIAAMERCEAAERRADAAEGETATMRDRLEEALGAAAAAEDRLVDTFRELESERERREAAERDAETAVDRLNAAQRAAALTSEALAAARAECEALREELAAARVSQQDPGMTLVASKPGRGEDDATPDRDFRPSVGTTDAGTASIPRDATSCSPDVEATPEASSAQRRRGRITSPSVDDEATDVPPCIDAAASSDAADPAAVATIQQLTKELLRRQRHLVPS